MKKIVESTLDKLIPNLEEPLFQAARYSLLSPGKRIRPLIVLETASSLGKDPLIALYPACAIEMIHTYSLIHDDLPCMDDDDLRRGRPTLHKVFGEATALLAGDYLLTYAFEVVAKAPLPASQKIEIIRVLSERAGAFGMIGGQSIDIESEGKTISEERLFKMHKGKTSALIQACFEIGAIAADATEEDRFELNQIGEELGLVYQIQDDLFNATSTTAILGKKAGSDQIHEKATAVSLFGIDGVKKKLETLQTSLFEKTKKQRIQGREIESFIQKILQRNS